MSIPLKVVTVGDKTTGGLVLDGARTAYCQGKQILRDEATLVEFGVNSAGDMAKGFAATVVAGGLAVALSGGSILAAGAIFAIVSWGMGKAFDMAEEEFGISKEITKEFERLAQ